MAKVKINFQLADPSPAAISLNGRKGVYKEFDYYVNKLLVTGLQSGDKYSRKNITLGSKEDNVTIELVGKFKGSRRDTETYVQGALKKASYTFIEEGKKSTFVISNIRKIDLKNLANNPETPLKAIMAYDDKIIYKGKHEDMFISPAFPMGKGDDIFTVSGPIKVACNPGEGKDTIIYKYKNGGKDLPEIQISNMDKNDRIKFQGKGLNWDAGSSFVTFKDRFNIYDSESRDLLVSASGTGIMSAEEHVL